jgi:pyruvate/2-oxoglutarate dehydrogenase complex dihydrolipoamide acyltransferase (E2) component
MRQDPFEPVEVVVPTLSAEGEAIEFVNWLVPPESEVIEGERIAELLTHGILFHLDAPADGLLTDLRATPGTRVREGEVLARVEPPH